MRRRSRCERLERRELLVASISVMAEPPAAVPEDSLEEITYTLTRDEVDGFLAVQFELSGEATYEVDYDVREIDDDTIWLPDEAPEAGPVVGTATFYPGEATVSLEVTPRSDLISEPDEDVVLTVVPADLFGPVYGGATQIESGEDTVYYIVDDASQLATVDVVTGVVDVIGTIDAGQTINDLAVLEDGTMFAISDDRLYEVFPESVSSGVVPTRFLGFHNIIDANALVDARDGDFGSSEGDLFAVGTAALDLQGIDLEFVGGQWEYVTTFTLFDIDATLAAEGFQSNFVSAGDLDYLDDDSLILSGSGFDGVLEQDFDSLIEIQTLGTGGTIENPPVPAQDTNEDFDDLFGLAFDGSDSYTFSGYTLLSVSRFTRDSSRVLELTGRDYDVGVPAVATGTILGDSSGGTTMDTVGLYQPDISLFHLKESFSGGAADIYLSFGSGGAGWVPLSGDWNGDGTDTVGLYRPDTSTFLLKNTFIAGPADLAFQFGSAGTDWVPMAGDWNGDGIDTIGLYQPDISLFHLKNTFSGGASDIYFAYGPSGSVGWTPLAGDWNGDGIDSVGFYQPDISLFHLKNTFTPGASDEYFAFGPAAAGWTPLAGDWDGDGSDTVGLFQPDISLFHLKNTFSGGASDVYFAFGPGGTDWTPLAGDWNGPSSTSPVASAAVSEATLDAVASRKPSDRLSDEPDRRDEDDAHLTLIDETLATW